MAERELEFRKVVDGDRLSGVGTRAGEDYNPVIQIWDHVGGTQVCRIESFLWANVKSDEQTTELIFQDRTSLTVRNGYVEYAYPK
jgi:hypothetical protein